MWRKLHTSVEASARGLCPLARPEARSASLSSPAYSLASLAPWGRRLRLEYADGWGLEPATDEPMES